ncbi:MAG: family 43 glycosylhydrolase [Nibricoccus sp.]
MSIRLSGLFFFLSAVIVSAVIGRAQPTMNDDRWDAPHAANPILPGYYADPSVISYEGKYFIYATLDPWGGETLACWESTDFKNWTYRELNWPTKKACVSGTSKSAMIWAPSVVRAHDGRFYMYVSVGSEVWVGAAEHPLGPWKNPLGDRPLIPFGFFPEYHMIDAEAFIDDDGTAYLYWGSGLRWKNGRCFAVKLNSDMASWSGEAKDVTPENYFEGPFMIKKGGRYFLTYSQGKTVSDTYQIHYSVGDSPFGPFKEAANSPILTTDHSRNIVSPGHHAIFSIGEKAYIAYHRHRVPYVAETAFRQLCVDVVEFTPEGTIAKIVPTHRGPSLVQSRDTPGNLATSTGGAKFSASSVGSGDVPHSANHAFDANFATRWVADNEHEAWLLVDLSATRKVKRHDLQFEYAWKQQNFSIEVSDDGVAWRQVFETGVDGVRGSPVVVETNAEARFWRIVFPPRAKGSEASLFEWAMY